MEIRKKYLPDINAQPKMFTKDFYNQIKDQAPLDFSLDLYFYYMAAKNNFKIETIPVYFGKRIHGEAKGGGSLKTKFKLSIRTIAFITDLRKKLKQK